MQPERSAHREKARPKDREEVERERCRLKSFIRTDDGIVPWMQSHLGVEKPNPAVLLALALTLSQATGIEIQRQHKRRKDLLIGWFNLNFLRLAPFLAGIVMIDENNVPHGDAAGVWTTYIRNTPNPTLLQYVRDDLPKSS
jgi:hypothetical protein